MIATQQEGYLYQFNDTESTMEKDNCIALYPFTAPVHKLIMEDYFLHALTETGLESYTLRIGHQLCRNFEIVDNVNVVIVGKLLFKSNFSMNFLRHVRQLVIPFA